MVKKLFNTLFYLAAEIALVFSLLKCFDTAFNLEAKLYAAAVSAAVVSMFFMLAAVFLKKRLEYVSVIAVCAAVFIAVLFFAHETLLSELNYVVNEILEFYSAAFPMPSYARFSTEVSYSAEFFFSVLGVLLSGFFSVSLFRAKRFLPVILTSLIVLVPCFILVDTVPGVLPITVSLSVLLALYATTFLRRKSFENSGFALAAAVSVILAASLIICNIFPQKNYKRYDWQESLLVSAENLTGIRGAHGQGGLAAVRHSIDDEIDLSREGGLRQTHTKELQVLAEHDGTVYLKGISYANYSDNTWSVLADEQEAEFPKNTSPFTIDADAEDNTEEISVITTNKSDYAFVPYFAGALPEKFTTVDDVLVKNNSGLLSYDFSCAVPGDFTFSFDISSDYEEFIAYYYTQLPDETKSDLLEIIYNDEALSEAIDNGDIDAGISAVREFVSSRGYYDLDCSKMPSGKDFPVWFLTEAESGYCVHYATAATALLRALGIPARYATGYYAGVQSGKWTTVTSDNAHAWAEYYSSELGWVPLEATPSDFTPAEYQPTVAEQLQQMAETTAPASMPATPAAPGRSNKQTKTIKLSAGEKTAVVSAAVLLSAVAVILTRAAVIKRRRKWKMNAGGLNDRAIYTFRYLEKLLESSNVTISDDIEKIALKARFGGKTVSRAELKLLKKFTANAKAELIRNSPAMKRLYLRWIKAVI